MNSILSSEWILINIALDTLLNAAQSSKQKALKLPWAQTQISYADRVSRTGAPKYFLIVACSTFQLRCRALAMCRDFHLFQNVYFAQPLNWCYLSICECSTLIGGRGQIHCDLTQSQFFMCVHIFYILSVYIVSLTVNFLCIWISSSWIIYVYKKHEKYFKGLVIILITWCPSIGWCPRALAQSRLWIIWLWLYEKKIQWKSMGTKTGYRHSSKLTSTLWTNFIVQANEQFFLLGLLPNIMFCVPQKKGGWNVLGELSL